MTEQDFPHWPQWLQELDARMQNRSALGGAEDRLFKQAGKLCLGTKWRVYSVDYPLRDVVFVCGDGRLEVSALHPAWSMSVYEWLRMTPEELTRTLSTEHQAPTKAPNRPSARRKR